MPRSPVFLSLKSRSTASRKEATGTPGFKGVVEANGTVSEIDEWGKRRLAYPIQDLMEGYYVLMTFTAAAAVPAELDRIFRITDGVIVLVGPVAHLKPALHHSHAAFGEVTADKFPGLTPGHHVDPVGGPKN